jgi:hypothetical protein
MRACAVGLVASFMFTIIVRAQPPELDDLLDKAADYVVGYKHDFAGVVAEEWYRQDVRGGRSGTDVRGFSVDAPGQRRVLKSDVLLVRAPGGDRWIQFRDVFEVDGKPVRDRSDRLTKLFLEPSRSVQKQIEDIALESARYNIGAINRTINLPVLALTVLDMPSRPWFSFTGSRKKDLWEVEFREERGGTLIRTTDNQSMPSHGRFSIEGATGRVVASEIISESPLLRAQIDVTYLQEPALGLLVPREMREKYESKDGSTIQGRASYSKYRRYQVTTDETVGTVKK